MGYNDGRIHLWRLMLILNVLEAMAQQGLVREDDTIVIGVSGGPDSMALLHFFINHTSNKIIAVHVNHMLRGDSASDDEAYVKNYCATHQIPLEIFNIDVAAVGVREGLSIEEAGRRVRYQCFDDVKQKYKAQKIATAHHAHDVIETLLMNLFRGSGVDGLASIAYQRDRVYIRPFLEVTRDEILEYCQQHHLNPCIDHTNDSNAYTRNRIRNELLPYLRTHFNERIELALNRTAQLMKTDAAFWENHIKRLSETFVIHKQSGTHLLKEQMAHLSKAEQTRLVRHCILHERGNLTDISFERVLNILALSETGKRIQIDDTLWAVAHSGNIMFVKLDKQSPVGRMNVSCRFEDAKSFNKDSLQADEYAIDADTLVGTLYVRTRQPGDRFTPAGMVGSKKLKDFFIDLKVPHHLRDDIPIICDDEKIICVYGYRLHEACKLTEKTQNIAIIAVRDIVEASEL